MPQQRPGNKLYQRRYQYPAWPLSDGEEFHLNMLAKPEQHPTILAIDDELDMLQLINRILTAEGFRVLTANAGNYGLNLLKDNEPNLVLLDIMMPGPDGHMVLESIRKISSVPVIMVTAKRDTGSVRDTLDAGADDYIKKPFRPLELISRINAKLRRC